MIHGLGEGKGAGEVPEIRGKGRRSVGDGSKEALNIYRCTQFELLKSGGGPGEQFTDCSSSGRQLGGGRYRRTKGTG